MYLPTLTHPLSCAEAKKMKLLALHTHSYLIMVGFFSLAELDFFGLLFFLTDNYSCIPILGTRSSE